MKYEYDGFEIYDKETGETIIDLDEQMCSTTKIKEVLEELLETIENQELRIEELEDTLENIDESWRETDESRFDYDK